MLHQTFPWAEGKSMSPAKLLALTLPKVAGKSVLDVGCNAGFFCGFAEFRGASRVVGVDNDAEAIGIARELFPHCQFWVQDWQNLPEMPEDKFDIILCLDGLNCVDAVPPDDSQGALDYMAALLASLVDKLTPGGVLVL